MTVAAAFRRFLVVGAVGFAVDGGLVWLLVSSGLNPFLTRCFSFPIAVIVTWRLNRAWTFPSSPGASRRGHIMTYFAVQFMGAMANLAVYTLLLLRIETTALNALIAFGLGSMAGLFVNFEGSRRFVFASPLRDGGIQGPY